MRRHREKRTGYRADRLLSVTWNGRSGRPVFASFLVHLFCLVSCKVVLSRQTVDVSVGAQSPHGYQSKQHSS